MVLVFAATVTSSTGAASRATTAALEPTILVIVVSSSVATSGLEAVATSSGAIVSDLSSVVLGLIVFVSTSIAEFAHFYILN